MKVLTLLLPTKSDIYRLNREKSLLDRHTTVRMLTPPMCFWQTIKQKEWELMSESDQDNVIEQAKKHYNL